MKNLLYLLFICVLFTDCGKDKDCPTGFSGEDCTTELAPRRVDIVSLAASVTSTGWDGASTGSLPDLFFLIESSSHEVLLETAICVDANTCSWNGTLSFGATENCILRVLDDDGAGFRQQIGAFNLALYQNGGGFPATVSGTLSGLTVEVGLAYEH